jgi:hypothetical protein
LSNWEKNKSIGDKNERKNKKKKMHLYLELKGFSLEKKMYWELGHRMK